LRRDEKMSDDVNDVLKVAVIGAGYWGKKVIGEYLHLAQINPKVDLALVCDPQDRELDYCNKVLHVDATRLTRDYDVVLNSKDVAAVHICTPNETHHPVCTAALNSGKHVLLEKPMALTSKHAWDLVGTARSRDLILQVGHIFRFNNALKMMRDLIAQEYFGDLYYLKLQWTMLMPSPINRDIIFDLGPHPVDILNYLLKKWPRKVACKAKAYRREQLEELAYFTVEYDRELMAHIELSWLEPGKIRRTTVIGSERGAVVDCLNQSIAIQEDNQDGFNLEVSRNNTILDEISHFVASININKNSKNSGPVGAKNVEVLEYLKRARREERTLKIDWRE
jgi:UDP-N-acetylglucosamine 3-dehydrogenase